VTGPVRRVVVEADGGSRGNPGPAGFGAVVRDADTGKVLAERAAGIGRATNNVAEYRGLIAGLQAARDLGAEAVDVRMDSKLVVEQMSGRWRVRHPDLASLYAEASALAGSLPKVRFSWVPRESNRHADRLANEAMDAAAAGTAAAWSAPATKSARPGSPAAGTAAAGTVAAAQPAAGTAAAAGRSPGWGAPTGLATSLLLLRHGETRYSPQRRFSGRGDVPLTERGVEQSAAAARRLAAMAASGHEVAAVLTSPLRRAQVTAATVAAELGLRPLPDEDLVETDFGSWEGLTFAEVQERFPRELDAWLRSEEVAPPGGESFAATAARVGRARDRLLAAYPGQTVVVVSHVTPIKTLLRLALDAPASALYRLHLDVGSLSIVDWYADGPATVRLVNDTSHLAG
jgi:broad specificity phosphatase PhoE/ribonuclease HI